MSSIMRWLKHGVLLLALTMVACGQGGPTSTQAPTTSTVAVTPSVQPTVAPGLQPTAVPPTPAPTSQGEPLHWELTGQMAVANPRELIWAFDGQVLGITSETGLHVARVANLAQTRIITITAPSVLLDFSVDGHTIALTSDSDELTLEDVNTGQVLHTLQPPQRMMNASFSPDGRMLAVPMEDLAVSLWDVASGQWLKTLGGFETAAPVYSVLFGSDGQHLIWVSRAKVQVMDIATGKLGEEFRHEDFVMAAALSPNVPTLASASAEMVNGQYVPFVKLWDASSGQEAGVLAHTQSVSSIAFSPKGDTLATACGKELIVWDVASQKELARWEGHADSIGAVALSPDGSTLASASADGTVKLWRAAP